MLYDEIGAMPVVDTAFASLNVAAIAVGDDARCVLTTAGAVKCTGNAASGALGTSEAVKNGIDFTTAYDVDGLSSGVTEVSCGDAFCCARTAAGAAKCWGYNASGQIGNATKVDATTPVTVNGLGSNVASVVVGQDHACALTSSGGVVCWGANARGQLGNGGTTASLVPVAVTGLASGVASISAGYFTTCAVTTSGAVKCWGVDTPADAASMDSWGSLTPATIPSLDSGVASASAGGFLFGSCAVSTGGIVKCWGYDSTELDPISEMTSGAMVAAGWDFACGLTTTGGVRCWGDDSKGQLGNGATSTSDEPAQTVVGFP
jgi:alpha-tubulin suppressor-like RCC1 family protein